MLCCNAALTLKSCHNNQTIFNNSDEHSQPDLTAIQARPTTRDSHVFVFEISAVGPHGNFYEAPFFNFLARQWRVDDVYVVNRTTHCCSRTDTNPRWSLCQNKCCWLPEVFSFQSHYSKAQYSSILSRRTLVTLQVFADKFCRLESLKFVADESVYFGAFKLYCNVHIMEELHLPSSV